MAALAFGAYRAAQNPEIIATLVTFAVGAAWRYLANVSQETIERNKKFTREGTDGKFRGGGRNN
jgi:hypothetical protein